MAKRGRPNVKGLTDATSQQFTVRFTPDMYARLKLLAAAENVSVGDVLRGFAQMAIGDPSGVARLAVGMVREDLGGPRVEVERILVDHKLAEMHGQLRLPT